MRCQGVRSESLLEPMMQSGRLVEDIRSHCAQCLALLPPEYRRFESPHIYKVGISARLQKLRDDLRRERAQVDLALFWLAIVLDTFFRPA